MSGAFLSAVWAGQKHIKDVLLSPIGEVRAFIQDTFDQRQKDRRFVSRETNPTATPEECAKQNRDPFHHFEAPDAIWSFLDAKAERCIESNGLVLDKPCLMISSNIKFGRGLAEIFSRLGGEVHMVTDLDEGLGALQDQPNSWLLTILDIDSFGDAFDLSVDIMDFRLEAPEVPVLLLSASFARDDLTEERLPICDASVRKPFKPDSIVSGAKAAIQNNTSWRSRHKALYPEFCPNEPSPSVSI